MTGSSQRALNFHWPASDVTHIRTEYLAARRVYRQPAPGDLNLTLSAFTETAYRIARVRLEAWGAKVLSGATTQSPREGLSVTWTPASMALLDDDWDDLVEFGLRTRSPNAPGTDPTIRVRVRKSDVARLAVLDGLEDWRTWIRSCPNDPRRHPR